MSRAAWILVVAGDGVRRGSDVRGLQHSLTVADFGCFQTEFVAGCP